MSLSTQIAHRFREVLLEGDWVASNFKTELSHVNWQQATTKVASLNTIAALTFHINYYIAGVLQVFEGGSLVIKDKYSYDFPPIKSQEDWDALLTDLWNNAEKFADRVEHMPDHKLNEDFYNYQYGTYRRNINGMIEHCYYHLGQIVLIKKMLQKTNNTS